MLEFNVQASSSATATNAEELAELNRKLKSSEDDLSLVNKRFDEAQGKSKLRYSLMAVACLLSNVFP